MIRVRIRLGVNVHLPTTEVLQWVLGVMSDLQVRLRSTCYKVKSGAALFCLSITIKVLVFNLPPSLPQQATAAQGQCWWHCQWMSHDRLWLPSQHIDQHELRANHLLTSLSVLVFHKLKFSIIARSYSYHVHDGQDVSFNVVIFVELCHFAVSHD